MAVALLKWRTAADGVTAALGVNLWTSLVFIPGLFVGAFRGGPAMTLLSALPLLVLAVGVARRSAVGLLFAFPAALLLPVAYDVRVVSSTVHGPVTFTLTALGAIAYLYAVSLLSAFHEPPAPARSRRLTAADEPVPARWRRRFRIYGALAALSVVFPAALLYAVNFSPANLAYLRELYPGRVQAVLALMNLGVLALWLGIYFVHFLGLLRVHRTGDRGLLLELQQLKDAARRQKPRRSFYGWVVLALLAMAALVIVRYR